MCATVKQHRRIRPIQEQRKNRLTQPGAGGGGAGAQVLEEACQAACKPGSVPLFPKRKERGDHSSGTALARRLKRPTRTAARRRACCGQTAAPVPIRSCSRRGLPCPLPCGRGGGLLPHRFTLARRGRSRVWRSDFCGAVPEPVARPAGISPAPCLHGARTFLSRPAFATGRKRPPGRLTPPLSRGLRRFRQAMSALTAPIRPSVSSSSRPSTRAGR